MHRWLQELRGLEAEMQQVQAAKAEKDAQLKHIKAQVAEIDKAIKAATSK